VETQLCSTCWVVRGFNEFVLGYNALLSRRLFAILESYPGTVEHVFREHLIHKTLPNAWHWCGVDEALEYLRGLSMIEQNRPLELYDTCLAAIERRDMTWTNNDTKCGLCLHKVREGVTICDGIQDDYFCSRDHALQHRTSLFNEVPQLKAMLSFPYCPLPSGLESLRKYLLQLPSSTFQMSTQVSTGKESLEIEWSKHRPTYEIQRIRKIRNLISGT
jgi:hypothetical protein